VIGTWRSRSFTRPLPRAGVPPVIVQIASLAAGALLWEVVFGYVLDIRFIPPLSDVARRFLEIWENGILPRAVADSLFALVVGYLISAIAGVLVGAAMVASTKVNQMLNIYINSMIVSPGIVLGPIFFLIFGLSQLTLIAIIIVFSFPFIVLNTSVAISQVPRDVREMARVMGASRLETFWLVTLRSAMPLLVAGLRIGMGRAVKGMFVGQLVVTVVGLGYLGLLYQGAFDAAGALAVGFTVVVIAICAIGLIQLLDKRVNWWVGR
jgi:NitT/TauT family transport system permease protein